MRLILKLILVGLSVIICGIFVFKMCIARMVANSDPQQSLRYFPGYSKALFALNEIDLRAPPNATLGQNIQERSQLALPGAPISDLPFLYSAFGKSIVKGELAYRELFLAAKARNIHNKRALRGLVAIGYAKQDFPDVIENLDVLLRLGGRDHTLYRDAMSSMAIDVQGNEIVNSYLQGRAVWGSRVLYEQIVKMGIYNIDLVSKSLSAYSKTSAFSKTMDETNAVDKELYEQFLEKLMQLKAYDQVYTYWLRKAGGQSAQPEFFIHDYSFKGSEVYLPFNWKLYSTEKLYAQFDDPEGLYASYADNFQGVLASQVLKLSPSQSYQLEIAAQWTYRQRQGFFSWNISCLPSNQIIAQLKLNDEVLVKGERSALLNGEFQVPDEGCTLQKLQLLGSTGQYSQRIWAKTKYAKIIQVRP